MASTRPLVLAAYRRLLRARAVAFAGDATALRESHLALRQGFEEARHEAEPAKIEELLRGADEVVDFLTHNVVQGKLNDEGSYAVAFDERHTETMAKDEHIAIAEEPPSALDMLDSSSSGKTESCGTGGCKGH